MASHISLKGPQRGRTMVTAGLDPRSGGLIYALVPKGDAQQPECQFVSRKHGYVRPRWGRVSRGMPLSAGQDLRLCTCDPFGVLLRSFLLGNLEHCLRPFKALHSRCYLNAPVPSKHCFHAAISMPSCLQSIAPVLPSQCSHSVN